MQINQRARLKLFSTVNAIGFPLITLIITVIVFIQSITWGHLLIGSVLIFSISFTVVGIITKRNLVKVNPHQVQGIFLFTVGITALPLLSFNEKNEVAAFICLMSILILGYLGFKKLKNEFSKLEVINYIGILFQVFLITLILRITI